jgi:hypothetical protein
MTQKPLTPAPQPQPPSSGTAPSTPAFISGHIQPDPQGKRRRAMPGMVEAMRELVSLGSDNPRMQEGYFIDFLHQAYDSANDRLNTALWYQTFGTFRKGIDVTDAAGNVLFVCPPILSVLKTRLGESKNLNGKDQTVVQRSDGKLVPTISEIASQAALNGRRHAALETKVMNEGLAIYRPEIGYDVHPGWRDILVKYGLVKEQAASKTGMTADDLLSDEGEPL